MQGWEKENGKDKVGTGKGNHVRRIASKPINARCSQNSKERGTRLDESLLENAIEVYRKENQEMLWLALRMMASRVSPSKYLTEFDFFLQDGPRK